MSPLKGFVASGGFLNTVSRSTITHARNPVAPLYAASRALTKENLMPVNRISATLGEAERQAVIAAIQTIRQKLPDRSDARGAPRSPAVW